MFLVYSRHGCQTGRQLRAALECRGGFPSRFRRMNPDALIRWGYSGGNDPEVVLNSAEAVARAANKYESLRILEEAGIDVPRFSTNPADFGDEAVVFGRRNSHQGGTDIDVLEGLHTRAVYSDFFTEFVPSVREVRLHLFQGRCIGAQVKRYEGEGEEDTYPIRNHARGYVFVPYVHTQPHRRRVDVGLAAIEALGLDFGAVDALVTDDDRTVVLEVNTAPSLSERFLNIYEEAMSGWSQQG